MISTTFQPALKLDQVSVNFGQVDVLQNISLEIPAGETLAIVGPNGAGKSTLIKVALGLVKPSKGQATIFGLSAGHNPKCIGYVPQLKTFDRSFPATALELVVSGLRQSWPARIRKAERERALELLDQVGASAYASRQLAKLSGGELQRVFLGRALARRPDIVFLDEPATGVDFLAEHDLYDLLENYQRNTSATIVMITHDLAAARYHATLALVMNRRLHGIGMPSEVLCERCLSEAYGHIGHEHGLHNHGSHSNGSDENSSHENG